MRAAGWGALIGAAWAGVAASAFALDKRPMWLLAALVIAGALLGGLIGLLTEVADQAAGERQPRQDKSAP